MLYLLANEMWKMPTEQCTFIRDYVIAYIYQVTPFSPVDYVPHTEQHFTVCYEMKTNGT